MACQTACMEWNDLRDEIGSNTGAYQNPHDLTDQSWTLMRFAEYENPKGDLEWLIRKDGCMTLCGSRVSQGMPGAGRRMKDVINNREEDPPEVGRYNAGQKLLFYVIVVCMAGLLLSGLVIWREFFSLYFSIGLIRLAAVVHALCAFLLVCAIIVHIYAAVWVKGSVEAMTRGTVTPGWAWKHHRAWFRKVTKQRGSG